MNPRLDTARRTRLVAGETGRSRWEMALRAVRPDLAGIIRNYCGYSESAPGCVRRLEYPGPQVVVIIEFGPPVRVYDAGQWHTASRYPGGFVAGLDDRFTIVEHEGLQRGLQVNLTPLGARAVFGLPLSVLTGRVVPLADLLGAGAASLADRLESLPTWDARFDLVEQLVAERLEWPPHARAMAWAVGEIARRGGRVDVRALGQALGYSPRHVIALFRDHVGLPPKLLARIIRFDCLMEHVRHGRGGTWAELAARFGYYDQSHLVRDVRQFTGATPTAARASLTDLSALG